MKKIIKKVWNHVLVRAALRLNVCLNLLMSILNLYAYSLSGNRFCLWVSGFCFASAAVVYGSNVFVLMLEEQDKHND